MRGGYTQFTQDTNQAVGAPELLTIVPVVISVGITVAPFYAGVALGLAFQILRKNINYVPALCLGFSLYFFKDVLADSSYLGVNKGLSGGV